MTVRRVEAARERVLVVIPARLASLRLPNKMLLDATGWPLIRHTWERVKQARRADAVVVATDSPDIAAAVTSFGGEVVLTSTEHRSGTDRVAEVARNHPEFGLIVNVQGDEPEIDPLGVDLLIDLIQKADALEIATLATLLTDGHGDPSKVKVVCNLAGEALYFSRAPIPHFRGREDGAAPKLRATVRRQLTSRNHDPLRPAMPGPYLHVGSYAFRRETLINFASLPPSELELTEGLEQLRALEHGIRVRVGVVRDHAPGIDTQEDYNAFVQRVRLGEAETHYG